jgi:hypothetical protein
MNLIEVDIICLKPAKARINLAQDCLTGKAATIRLVAHHPVHLGRNHRAVALRVVLQKSSQNLFALASRIDVGRVEEVDTKIESLLEKWLRISLIQCLGNAGRNVTFNLCRDTSRSGCNGIPPSRNDWSQGLTHLSWLHVLWRAGQRDSDPGQSACPTASTWSTQQRCP